MKIGLFGGTFDPVHIGHLRSAVEVRNILDLDEIWFIPAASPPHKQAQTFASFEHRFEMLKLGIKDIDFFKVLDVEAQRPGPSFTIDTINELQKDAPEGTQFFLVIGSDQLMTIETWKDYRQIPSLASIIVMERPMPIQDEADLFEQIPLCFPQMSWDADEAAFVGEDVNAIYPVAVTSLDISSSALREMLNNQTDVSFLTPETVKKYIYQNNLYLPEKTKKKPENNLTERQEADVEIAFNVMELLNKSKAKDVIGLDLRGLSDVTDFFIIASGRSARQNQGIADELSVELKKLGIKPRAIEATKENNWILMDYGDWIVHVFQEETRQFYDLEGLWHDAPKLIIAEGL